MLTEQLKKMSEEETKTITAISMYDLLARDFPPRKNLLDPWLPEQGIAMVHAYRGVGKTQVSVGIAVAVATGGSFLKWKAPRPAGLVFVDGEMPGALLQDRFSQAVAISDGQGEASTNIVTPDLQEYGIPDLATPEGQAQLEAVITPETKLVIVDNISTVCRSARENKGDAWLPVQEWALRMRSRGISVLLIHHDGKGGGQRGTSRREDVLDTVIQLRHPTDYQAEQGAMFEVHFNKTRGLFGDDVKPFEAQLTTNGWVTRTIEDSKFEKVRCLLDDGYTQRQIAEELGISKGYVSKLVKKINAQK